MILADAVIESVNPWWIVTLLGGVIGSMATFYIKVAQPQLMAIVRDAALLLKSVQDAHDARLDKKEALYLVSTEAKDEAQREERERHDIRMSREIDRLQLALTDLTKVLQAKLK